MTEFDERVDVVIPVYNAQDLTRRCIDSLYRHVEHRIEKVIVHDNASDEQTARMLDELPHARLDVYHASQNAGFGCGVNQGIARASSPLVLVLNSDVEAHDDFVTPLVVALRSAADLIAVMPSGSELSRYELFRYVQRSECVVSYTLRGFAFLIRRSAFCAAGGFDERFGLGYFEDTDLARRLIGKEGWFGIHTGSTLDHADHGSFSDPHARRALLEQNRHIYHGRYPDARRNVLLASRTSRLRGLPPGLLREAEETLRAGGTVHWLSPSTPDRLLALQMRDARLGPAALYRILRKSRRRPYMQLSELWLLSDLPRWKSAPLERVARATGMKVRVWHEEPGAADEAATSMREA